MTTSTQIKLVGDELIAKVKSSGVRELPKKEMVLACGYINENGNPDYCEFYTQLLIAKGVEMGGETKSTPRELTGGNVTYFIHYQVKSSATITVEGKDGLSREEVLDLVTREDLSNCETEIQFDDVCDSFDEVEIEDFYITLEDEDGDTDDVN